MDKLLLTAFLSSLIGFITAVLSVVKLVNEKENKTTEYRQAWTDSIRKSLADLISNLNTQASNIVSLSDSIDVVVGSHENSEDDESSESQKRYNDVIDNRLKEEQAAVRAMRREIYLSYAFTRLHFKPNDISFSRIEHKFDVVMGMIDDFKSLTHADKKADRRVLKEKIHSAVADITNYSRDILKTEWESVKKGERAYQATKKWSLIGGAIMLFIIISIGIHALFVAKKSLTSGEDSIFSDRGNVPIVAPQPQYQAATTNMNSLAPSANTPALSISTNVECVSSQVPQTRSPAPSPKPISTCQK